VAVSKSEPLPKDGQVRQKSVAVDCDFNVILNERQIVNRVELKMKLNVLSNFSSIVKAKKNTIYTFIIFYP
jgi:3-phosphoglycerate kinase